jgi:hypothetical protein
VNPLKKKLSLPRYQKPAIVVRLGLAMLLIALGVLPAAACAAVRETTGSIAGGIQGVVLIGPVTPVSHEGEANEKPYAGAVIKILNAAGTSQVGQFTSDSEGRFKMDLAPGTYVLAPQTPENKPLPVGEPQTVTVGAGFYTDVTIRYDSGIR